MSWNEHIDYTSKKTSSGISALKRMKSTICRETAIKTYQGLN